MLNVVVSLGRVSKLKTAKIVAEKLQSITLPLRP